MVFDAKFALISFGQLAAPAAAVLISGPLLYKGDYLLGGAIFLTGIGSYLFAQKIVTQMTVKNERAKARQQANRLKTAQENRLHSIEKAEQHTRKVQENSVLLNQKTEQHTRKVREKGLLSFGKKIIDEL